MKIMVNESGMELNKLFWLKPMSINISTKYHEIVNQESIANVLNEFFANIGSNLARSIPNVTQTATEFIHLLFVIPCFCFQ